MHIGSLSALAFSLLLAGCGTGTIPSTQTLTNSATVAPSITRQPTSITVPMGLTGAFSVAFTGNGTLTAQWYRNGVPISAADGDHYTTPATAFSDSGAVFTFTVSNSLGSATSQGATLTVGARAPKAGDLRFQQVDSENTVNGYSGAYDSVVGNGASGIGVSAATGTGLYVAAGECVYQQQLLSESCFFAFSTGTQPVSAVTLFAGYCSGVLSNLETEISTGPFPAGYNGGGSLLAANNVITSLALSTIANEYGLSYTQTTAPGGFDLLQHAVAPASMQAAATQEGLASRVITAISYNASGQLMYFSYGWTGDTTTAYDTQVATATYATVGTVVAALGVQGYMITAFGGDDTNGLILIGTRVRGDTLPRPTLVALHANLVDLQTGGYAVVATSETQAGNVLTITQIGQR